MISIHAAREGGDFIVRENLKRWYKFQSTPPVKAATQLNDNVRYLFGISIHAAREGGDAISSYSIRSFMISIHAAREGGDNYEVAGGELVKDFNPRRP